MFVFLYINSFILNNVYVCIYIYIYIYMVLQYMYVCMYVYIYIYIYVCVCGPTIISPPKKCPAFVQAFLLFKYVVN